MLNNSLSSESVSATATIMKQKQPYSSSFTCGWTYDVFLSFRGQDTRFGFIGNLYNALHQKGIHTFIDYEELRRGEEITPALLKAIEESRIAIIVFSKSYAYSTFCLNELAHILELVGGKGRLVLPVFYDVDPSDVRHQKGSYGDALANHGEKFQYDKVQKWGSALQKAANLSGWHFILGDEYEYQFIGRIIKEVSNKVNRVPLHIADYPVGLEFRVPEVISVLKLGLHDIVHMVGIYGIGGVGKSTTARAVYNLIADSFDNVCFLADVRENSFKHGLVHLQEELLSELVGENNMKLGNVNKGISVIKHRLHRKRVLLILDDVNKSEQLCAIAGGLDWFGSGSRIIITTRDKHLLARHGVEITYEAKELNFEEAQNLLCWNAFRHDEVASSYVHVLNRLLCYAGGLPLALEVIGSNLYGKTVEEWKSAFDKYDKIPNKEVQKILEVSFDALEEDEKKIFLDIACFFKGCMLKYVEEVLFAHYGVHSNYSIGVLIEKSLIKVDWFGCVILHDLIQGMGREIVRKESPKEPGSCSRLWCYEDIVHVLEENTGTSKIEVIILEYLPNNDEVICWDGEAFKTMKNLRTLIIRNVRFSRGPKYLPNSLRVLEWWGYPSKHLPADFHGRKLAMLKLPQSCFTLIEPLKKMENVSVLTFDKCKFIRQIPDLSGVPNLAKLSLVGCENLIEVHDSVGFLEKLRILDAFDCMNLRTLPCCIRLPSLKHFRLSGCSSLKNFPEILGEMEGLTQLDLSWSAIEKLPFSIWNLMFLEHIYLNHCANIQLPSSIFMLPTLHHIIADGCAELSLSKEDRGDQETLSSMMCSPGSLLMFKGCGISDECLALCLTRFSLVKYLHLGETNIIILPACIQECSLMTTLNLDDCKHLQEIRGIPPKIKCIWARNCTSLSFESKNKLLAEELHEVGGTTLYLPGARIAELVDNCWRDAFVDSRGKEGAKKVSFWFHGKFPTPSLCHVNPKLNQGRFVDPNIHCIYINGNRYPMTIYMPPIIPMVEDHIHVYPLSRLPNLIHAGLREWNHVEISYPLFAGEIHLLKKKCSLGHIRFTNPYLKTKLDIDYYTLGLSNGPLLKMQCKLGEIGVPRIQCMQQLQQLASLIGYEEQCRERPPLFLASALQPPEDDVNRDLNSIIPNSKIGTTFDKALAMNPFDEVNWGLNSTISPSISGSTSNNDMQQEQHLASINQQISDGSENVNDAKGKGKCIMAWNSN